ncbi:unnamed protein product [Lymnaea stagnalis]|uniref:RUN domain-containing protein n=1 Tax=Lymnaea stagnalis TaxID=6523 RepID=A0AAV2HWT0_LYMST
MLQRRQINVQKQNLAAMCRISVKSLLDYACLYTHVDDECEEFINFCAVFEQMVSHRLRPHQKKVWMPGHGSPRHFWDVLLENQHSNRGFAFKTCIPNIEAIETIKSPKAKLRAFIRVALMEKRLSDYLFWLLDNSNLIRESYLDGATMSSDEATVLCGDLIGLNAIDFNFCLKGNENELLGPLEISYAPFIKYKQTSASQCSDEIEMQRLSGKLSDLDMLPGNALTERNVNDILRLQALEKDFKSIKEQKDYLEELVRLRERQIGESNMKLETVRVERDQRQKGWEIEQKAMDACVLELQAEISKLRKQNENLKTQVASLRLYKDRMEMKEVPMMDMARVREREAGDDKPDVLVEMDHIEGRFSMLNAPHFKKERSLIPSDRRSILSSVSDHIRQNEDSQSMIPLTGSLADVNVAMLDSGSKQGEINSGTERVKSVSVITAGVGGTVGANGPEDCELEKEALPSEISSAKDKPTLQTQEVSGQEISVSVLIEGTAIAYNPLQGEMPAANQAQQTELDSNASKNSNSIAVDSSKEVNNEAQIHDGSGSCAESERTGSGAESESAGSRAECERDDEVIASDPEIINKSNSSSEVGDATWEMLSDSEQHENQNQ